MLQFHEQNYWKPRFQAQLSCEERARLIRWASEWQRLGRYTQDVVIDPKRIAFARYLIARGKLSEWGV